MHYCMATLDFFTFCNNCCRVTYKRSKIWTRMCHHGIRYYRYKCFGVGKRWPEYNLDPRWNWTWSWTDCYTSRDYYDDAAGTYRFILAIGQYSSRYDGLYKCFIAEGNSISYVEIAYAIRYVSIPGSEIPTCIPNNNFRVLIYTNTTSKCMASKSHTDILRTLYIYGKSSFWYCCTSNRTKQW